MHREIQIKQFPIVTTHWWPKTRNERFVWENEQYLYRFFTSCTQPCPSDLSAMNGIGICMRRSDWLTPPLALEKLRQHHASDTPSIKRWRRRPVWMQREPERAHTHTSQITWTWLCTRGKKRYKYCSFSHTNRSFRVLGHQCVVTMGNCLISLCMFFFPSYRDSDLYLPLYDWQTRTVWPKNIKIGSTEEKKTTTSWMPLG